jgi:hypothetical protein
MARGQGIAVTEVEEVVMAGPGLGGADPSATSWAAIFGGALGAMGVTLILFTAGAGFGISTIEPWTFTNVAPETFAIGAGIWLIAMQWLSAAFGGYLAGRLRTKWVGVRTDEVLFRDTAHGLLTWALATLIVAALFMIGASLGGVAVDAVTEGAPAAEAAEATAATAQQVADTAANFAIFTSISLLVGAFVGAAAAALGGYHRDDA